MKKKSGLPAALNSESGGVNGAAADDSLNARSGDSRTDGSEFGEGAKGSALTNREPYNCNSEYFKLLMFGVDSLYLSYQGDIFSEVQERLAKLKQLAQHPEIDQQALAQYSVAGHVFEVKDKAPKPFSYVLEDGAFRIHLPKSSKRLPMAYVKLSSKYLTSTAPKEAEAHLRAILDEFGTVTQSAHVSRIDLCADFICNEDMDSWKREAWVTRAKKKDTHSVNDDFTGWSIGMGGIMSFRLYNKILQHDEVKRDDLPPLWKFAGWEEGQMIWRGEFQFRREVLSQHKLILLDDVLAHLGSLWSYGSTKWLRLTIPMPNDKTRSRWPLHPLWSHLSSMDWKTDGKPLSRSFVATRLPEDKKIFSLGVSSIASYMAKHSVTEYSEGIDRYLTSFYSHLVASGFAMGQSAEDFLLDKVRLRARAFNTILNPSRSESDEQSIELATEAYRKASRGG